ncbi:MAG: hypothetical protein JSV64_08685 [Candidatus Bathyarchaeota archaeon]|nr:MAG: hypothetical protein JSV64_08685 [Candidatus Bathyarchaeota archaeon]
MSVSSLETSHKQAYSLGLESFAHAQEATPTKTICAPAQSILVIFGITQLMLEMKCLFNPKKECTAFDSLKELVDHPDPYRILEYACPLCPNRPFPERPFPKRPFPKRPERPL